MDGGERWFFSVFDLKRCCLFLSLAHFLTLLQLLHLLDLAAVGLHRFRRRTERKKKKKKKKKKRMKKNETRVSLSLREQKTVSEAESEERGGGNELFSLTYFFPSLASAFPLPLLLLSILQKK